MFSSIECLVCNTLWLYLLFEYKGVMSCVINVQPGWLVEFYGISTFVGYLMPNPFLCK